MWVDIDVSKPLPPQIRVGLPDGCSYWQVVVYKNPPAYCNICLHLGHSNADCKSQKRSDGSGTQQDKRLEVQKKSDKALITCPRSVMPQSAPKADQVTEDEAALDPTNERETRLINCDQQSTALLAATQVPDSTTVNVDKASYPTGRTKEKATQKGDLDQCLQIINKDCDPTVGDYSGGAGRTQS